MDNYEKVEEYLRKNGPSHPVQVGKAIEADIFTSSAILQEMIADKRIERTIKKIGGSPLYFVPEHRQRARERVEESLGIVERKILEEIKQKGFVFQDELGAQARFILQELKDLLIPLKANIGGEERIIWKYYKVDNSSVERAILSGKFKKQEEEKGREEIRERKGAEGVERLLEKINARLLEKKVIKKNEINCIIERGDEIKQKYFLKIKNKKKISDSDISLAYMEGMNKKMPIIFATTGTLSKKAIEKKKEFGSLFFVMEM